MIILELTVNLLIQARDDLLQRLNMIQRSLDIASVSRLPAMIASIIRLILASNVSETTEDIFTKEYRRPPIFIILCEGTPSCKFQNAKKPSGNCALSKILKIM